MLTCTTPGRMQEKGVISDILDWKTSRTFFYWRLRRLLLEDLVKKKIHNANPELTDGQIQAMLRRWFVEVEGTVKAYVWDNNKDLAEWLEKQLTEEDGVHSVIEENIKCISRDYVLKQIRSLVQANPEVAMDSIIHMTQHISPTQRAEVVRILSTMDSLPRRKTFLPVPALSLEKRARAAFTTAATVMRRHRRPSTGVKVAFYFLPSVSGYA